MKKIIIKIIIIIISLFLLLWIWGQSRNFYTVNNITFTVWKRFGGYCYITPYKYYGVTKPKNDYIIASNSGGIYVYIAKDSTLIIYDNAYAIRGIECNFSSFKWHHLKNPSPYDRNFAFKRDSLYGNLPTLDVDIRNSCARIKN